MFERLPKSITAALKEPTTQTPAPLREVPTLSPEENKQAFFTLINNNVLENLSEEEFVQFKETIEEEESARLRRPYFEGPGMTEEEWYVFIAGTSEEDTNLLRKMGEDAYVTHKRDEHNRHLRERDISPISSIDE